MTAILQAIVARHTDGQQVDREQLEAVFSSAPHLIVEAPAGYGKTRTMVSKIAFLIAKGIVGYPKRVLALTFSINAAFKIRSDVSQQLPSLLSTSRKLSRYALQAVYATNYHGLSRRILSLYGYLISPVLRRVDALKGVSIDIYEKDTYTRKRLVRDSHDWGLELTEDEIECLIQYTRMIKQAGPQDERTSACRYLARNTSHYLDIVQAKFLPKECIPFDAILLFVRQLLNNHPSVRRFYRHFFQVVIVDEFQDTNILQWTLLQDIVGRDNERQNPLYVFGDRHQKIYEFIGAMQGIIDEAKSYYGMQEIGLCTNHRFKNNREMLRFDHNVREIAQNPREPNIESIAEIGVVRSANQDEEAERIIALVEKLLDQDPHCTVAILTRAGKTNQNTIRIVDYLNREEGFCYFFALYSDEDPEYVKFHRECLSLLYSHLPASRSFHRLCDHIQADISTETPSETWASLQTLLKTFVLQISEEFRFLSLDEKAELMVDTLRNKALKQYLMYVTGSRVVLSTVHGSKGLEWDYVILPDMERDSFPHYRALCEHCRFRRCCQLDWKQVRANGDFENRFRQELNLFYVGGTRARRKAYFTYSDSGLNWRGDPRANCPSCFLRLDGLHGAAIEE